ncbi:hypothetical protein IX329_001979 [Fusobacterium necrophorum]|uniref:AtuA-related protein n=1 Tax=Fusobacterium necrophorum TaxID=859 RepID=UPI000461BFA2|nr:hypothetical protein [Fusobacterium necrophorum]KDE65963.1 beta-lactamase [Fusobacterium necrophorum BFTR-1]KDE72377.1 beta-lactamase [Fusobacterium necrophorum BFTR-2]MBR8734368.1 hypothetical protein [Fusobacterium necrophorum]MBR8790544.1 hypothetical protein [Fusobacterium necrophorum]
MEKLYLKDIAHGRSGDKGNTSNICVYARDPKDYLFLKEYLTVERVKKHFEEIVLGEIKRYTVDSLQGMNFVMKEALGGGATLSLRLDSLGKSMGSALMRLEIDREFYINFMGGKNEK